jgi:hypothetical protein
MAHHIVQHQSLALVPNFFQKNQIFTGQRMSGLFDGFHTPEIFLKTGHKALGVIQDLTGLLLAELHFIAP